MREKGQASLEFLLVLAAFLGFLAVWVGLFNQVEEGAGNALLSQSARLALADIASAANSVSSMGEGSMITVEAALSRECELRAANNELSIKCGGLELKQESRGATGNCSLGKGENKIRIKNKGGRAELSCNP